MNPGDIVLIPFPQADLVAGRLRPALVVARAPGRHGDLLIALISSQLRQAISEFDEIVSESDADFPDSHLKVTSVIRLRRLATVEERVISARLGDISQERLASIKRRMVSWLQA